LAQKKRVLGNFPKLLPGAYSHLQRITGRRRHGGSGNDNHPDHDDDNDDNHPREQCIPKLPI